MHSGRPWLGIDYGTAYTKAVLVAPSGESTLLRLDGDGVLSNAVHVGSGEVLVGAAAWQRAATHADGFVLSPLRAGDEPVHVGGADLDSADLVAASLRRVAGEAAAVAGGPVEDVRMVVPAGWGPRRRTWWRRVAGKAGLGQIRLVEAPVAAATGIARGRADSATVRWLILDVGAGCEVSVVMGTPGEGFEVLSTLSDPDAGGDRIDATMFEVAAGVGLDAVPSGHRWSVLSSVRAVKHALAGQPAVTMPLPDKPPVVVNTAMLRQAAQPVCERVGELAAQAVANADMTVAEVDAVYAVGAAVAVPGAADLIAGKLGVTPQVPPQPGHVAVLGVADAPAVSPRGTAADEAKVSLPPLRRLFGLALPGVLSLVLYAHFVFAAEFNNGTPSAPRDYYYVSASWGELTVAAVLALLTCLQAAALIGALLHQQAVEAQQRTRGVISSGIGVATAAGVALASLYGLTAAVFFAQPVGALLRWAVAPLLPIAVCAAVLAVVAWHRRPSAGGWDAFLAFPTSSILAAAVGAFAVSGWWQGHMPLWLNGWLNVLGYLGGLLLGVALACTISRHLLLRVALSVLLGFFSAVLSRSGLEILAVIYALAVAAWWAHRAWTLFRAPRAAPVP